MILITHILEINLDCGHAIKHIPFNVILKEIKSCNWICFTCNNLDKDVITLEEFKMGKSEMFQDFNFKLVVLKLY